jgi:predicted dehydrogenase
MNACHAIDYVRYVTGLEAEQVYAEVSTENSPVEVEDIATVTLRYAGGGVGSIDASSLARGEDREEERIWGTHGTLHLAPAPGRVYTLRKVAGLRPGAWQPLGRGPGVDQVAVYFDRFAAAVREGREPEISAEDGRVNLAVVLAAYEAAETHRAVRPRGVGAAHPGEPGR